MFGSRGKQEKLINVQEVSFGSHGNVLKREVVLVQHCEVTECPSIVEICSVNFISINKKNKKELHPAHHFSAEHPPLSSEGRVKVPTVTCRVLSGLSSFCPLTSPIWLFTNLF